MRTDSSASGPTGRPRRPATLISPALVAVICLALVVVLSAVIPLASCAPGGTGAGLRRPWTRQPKGLDPKAPIDPARQYHLVVWDYRLPFTSPSGARFSEASAQAIRRFEARYPNVTVDLVMLDPGDGPAKFAQALAAGYPPDVYCSPFGLPALGSSFQIPVGLYLDYDTWARYHPVAWQTVKVNGTVWAFPRWIMFWPWLGNRDILTEAGVDPGQVSTAGWTREEFAAAAARLVKSSDRWGAPVALAATSPAVAVRDLLFPGLLAGEAAPAADSYWLGSEPGAVAFWLSELRRMEALNQDGTGNNPGVIDSFIHGRAAVLASPSPWATLFILEPTPRPQPWQFSLPDRTRPPAVLVPPPHGPGQPSIVWVSPATVAVFRQARYKGDDHTRLAVELARELSTGTRPWLRDQVLCVPATFSELAAWKVRATRFGDIGAFVLRSLDQLAGLPKDRLSSSLSILNYGPWVPQPGTPASLGSGAPVGGEKGKNGGVLCRGYLGPFLDVISPAAFRFWDGDMAPGEFINEVTETVLSGP